MSPQGIPTAKTSSAVLQQLYASAHCIDRTLLMSPCVSSGLAESDALKLMGEEVIGLPIPHLIAAPCFFAIVRCPKLPGRPFSKASGDGNLPILKVWGSDHPS